jgi:putative sigma-54 modulation protein
MQITIHSVRFDADQKLLNFINRKIEKLTQFDDELISSDVFLRIENATDKSNKLVEVKINSGFNELFASKKCESFEEAVDLIQEILIRQVKKNKQKKRLV